MFRPVAQTLLEDLREAGEGPVAAVAIGSTLRAITAASRIALAAERGGIVADFARRMAAARASCDPRLLAGILRAIKEQRRAALAIASRNVGRESYEKRASRSTRPTVARLRRAQEWRKAHCAPRACHCV